MGKREPVTKEDVRDLLNEFWVQVLEPNLVTKSELQSELSIVKNELKAEIQEVKAEVKENRRQINDLKLDTPTQKEFDDLKQKVESYHPVL